MDMEQVENAIEETKIIQEALGLMNTAHYEEFKFNAQEGLTRFGSTFLQSLAAALRIASRRDAIKILRYWHKDCEEHALMYRIWKAKDDSMKAELG